MHPIGSRYRTGSHMVQFSPPHEFLDFYCVLSHYFTLSFGLNVQTGFAVTIKTSLRMLQSEVASVCLHKRLWGLLQPDCWLWIQKVHRIQKLMCKPLCSQWALNAMQSLPEKANQNKHQFNLWLRDPNALWGMETFSSPVVIQT